MRAIVLHWSFVAACLLAALPLSAARADEKVPAPRTISVTGQGEVTAAPDLAILTIAVETAAPKAAAAGSENAKRSAAVASAIKGLIGKDDKVTTSRYSLEPRYQPSKPGEVTEPRITGYVARNDVQVETHKVDGVGALIDAANDAGANRISGIQFTLANHNAQLRAALEKAGAEAHAQADSVAKALGVRLKEVASATTVTGPAVQPRYFDRGVAAMEARAPTPIEPGTVAVSATLQVTYSIE
ncbi:MAG: SIMPL domain-containing protein [Candidatus Binatia bacterium]